MKGEGQVRSRERVGGCSDGPWCLRCCRERREDMMGERDGRKVGRKWGIGPSAVEELLELEY